MRLQELGCVYQVLEVSIEDARGLYGLEHELPLDYTVYVQNYLRKPITRLLCLPGLLDTVVNGTPDQIRAALAHKGAPAQAFTAPIFVDFDGGGYRAPFAP